MAVGRSSVRGRRLGIKKGALVAGASNSGRPMSIFKLLAVRW